MKTLIIAVTLGVATAPAIAQEGSITRNGSQAATIGAEDLFTGTALVEPVFGTNENRPFSTGKVTFLPGARSNWHTHPHGQTLVVTSGTGWTQEEGGERQVINAGDVVWCPPGVRHWHGATDTTAITHLAIQQVEGDTAVEWMEPVTDAQYLGQ
ncbi:cupin domain-containing protein [Paracoccaceae bacterium GXU_MW_L88]